MAVPDTVAVSLRILEIIGLLLPLVAIFGQLALRLAIQEDFNIGAGSGESIVRGIQVAMTALFVAGLLVAGSVAFSDTNWVTRGAAIAIFYALVGIWLAAMTTINGMESAFIETEDAAEAQVSSRQERLTRWEHQEADKELETESDGDP